MSSQVMLMFLLTFVTLFEYNHNIRKFNQSTSSITSAHHDLLKFMTNYIKSKSHQHNYRLPLGVALSRRPLLMVGVGVLIKKIICIYLKQLGLSTTIMLVQPYTQSLVVGFRFS